MAQAGLPQDQRHHSAFNYDYTPNAFTTHTLTIVNNVTATTLVDDQNSNRHYFYGTLQHLQPQP